MPRKEEEIAAFSAYPDHPWSALEFDCSRLITMKRVIIIAKKSSPILLSCIPDNNNDDAEGEKLRNEIKWEEKYHHLVIV